MKDFFKIAWRNVWRNKRRSLITMSSIFFAVFLALIMRSFQLGSYESMINSMVEMYSGYIQIENKDFPEDNTIDNSIEYSQSIISKIESVENVKTVVPRLSSFSYAYSKDQSKGILFTGINPQQENEMTGLIKQLVNVKITEQAVNNIKQKNVPREIINKLLTIVNNYYSDDKILKFDLELSNDEAREYIPIIKKYAAYKNEYLKQNDKGVLISAGLAKYLKLDVGDSIILMGMGYHGVSAAGKFKIKGIVLLPNPKLNDMIIYGELNNVQHYFSTYTVSDDFKDTTFLLSTYAVNLKNKDDESIANSRDEIIKNINSDLFLVRGWKDANKELANQIKSDNETGVLMIMLLYVVIAFGVLGTVLMMIAERQREMGVMIAVGMKKTKLALIVSIEMAFISFVALVSGILVSVPFIILGNIFPIRLKGEMAQMMISYGFEPVMPLAWFGSYYTDQVISVIVIVLLVMIYPLISINRLEIIKALRG